MQFNIAPRYEFGFGLSYTTFALSDIHFKEIKPKSALPSPRPDGVSPPSYDETVPPVSDALIPSGFRKLKKYIYPYIDRASDVKYGSYPYPAGYDVKQPLSQAGGGEGGNPSLWDVHAEVEVTLTNTGTIKGQEVVQLYVSFPPATDGPDEIDFPVKVLRAFEKVTLGPRNSKQVKLSLTRKDLSYWSVRQQNWVMPTEGKFKLMVGTSSRNLPLRTTF